MSVALRAAGAHGGERLVTRRVDERDRVPVVHRLVRTDVLRDATGLAGDDVGVADACRAAWSCRGRRGPCTVTIGARGSRLRVVVFVVVAEQRLQLELGLLAGLDEQHLGTERLGDELDHLVGQRLRAGDHLARVEQQAHEVGRGAVELGRELLDGDAALDDDLALGNRGVGGRELRHRRGTEILEVATTTLLAPGPLTLRTGTTATAGTTAGATADHRGRHGHRRDRRGRHRDAGPPPDRHRATAGTLPATATAAATGTLEAATTAATATTRATGAAAAGATGVPGATRGPGGGGMRRPPPGGGGIGRPVALRGGVAGAGTGGAGGAAGAAARPVRAAAAAAAGRSAGAGRAGAGRAEPRRRGRRRWSAPDAVRGGGGGAPASGIDAGRADARDAGAAVPAAVGRGVGDGPRCGAGAGVGASGAASPALVRPPARPWPCRRGLGFGCGLGLVDDRLATEPFGVGEAADAVGERVVDARRVALDADLQALGEIEHHLVLDAELSRQLVDPDLLRGQARCLCFLYSVLHASPVSPLAGATPSTSLARSCSIVVIPNRRSAAPGRPPAGAAPRRGTRRDAARQSQAPRPGPGPSSSPDAARRKRTSSSTAGRPAGTRCRCGRVPAARRASRQPPPSLRAATGDWRRLGRGCLGCVGARPRPRRRRASAGARRASAASPSARFGRRRRAASGAAYPASAAEIASPPSAGCQTSSPRVVGDPLALGVLDAAARLLLGELRLALDVDAPAGEPRREAGVLALLADRERQLEVGDDHLGGAGVGVDAHLAHRAGASAFITNSDGSSL